MNDGCVPYDRLHLQARSVLEAWGMPGELSAVTADLMCQADLLGVDSHGISMLPTYETKLRGGILNIAQAPVVVKRFGATALVDGKAGLGHPAGELGMRTAMELAAEHGVGVAVVFNSHHFGAAGAYARLALKQGMVALVGSSATHPIMVPTGAREPALGTNPIAFAAPGAGGDTFVLDMATTTVAANKVKVYDYYGKTLPPGWVVDAQGAHVTDSAQGMDWIFRQSSGGLTPLGGTPEMGSHKGYGLAMMIQILSATLAGAAFAGNLHATRQPGDPDNVGHFMMALNPAAFREQADFQQDLSDMLGHLRGMPHVAKGETVKVAGDPENAMAARRAAEGVPLSDALKQQLRGVCERCGVAYVL